MNFNGAAKRITWRYAPRPSGRRPGRRSNWLRQFVEPAFCLSGVRIGGAEPSMATKGFRTAKKLVPQRGLLGATRRALRVAGPADDQIGYANLSNRRFVCQGFELGAPNNGPRRRVFSLKKIGAAKRIRTPDPRITNALLYQLSYCGIL